MDAHAALLVPPSSIYTLTRHLMAVLSDIHGAVPDPAEQKVSGGGAQNDGHKQPHVIRHDDQHEQVGDGHL